MMSISVGKKTGLAMVDFDGTLVFTERPNFEAYRLALAEAGFEIDFGYFLRECDGRNYRDFLPKIIGTDAALMKTVHDRKTEIYKDLMSMAEPNYQLIDMLKGLKPDYFIALVSTASRRSLERMLDIFSLGELFDLVIAGEDVSVHKPDPGCYNMAIEHFGIPRSRCIIFEDSPSGIEAAAASGCQTLCVKRSGV